MQSKVYLPAAEAFYFETKLKPGDFQAHLQLATAYTYLGKADLARPQYEAARKIDPSSPNPYWGLAYLNNTSERYPFALNYLQEYFKRGGQPGMGYGLLCRVYLNMKEYAKAVAAGKKAAAAMPDADSVWYNLGVAYADLPDSQSLSAAAQSLERAAQLTPNWADAHFELANVYSRLNRPADAIAQYREAIRYDPSRGNYFYQLGQLLIRQGQPAEGRQLLAKAQTLIPLNQRERQLLDQLAVTPNEPRLVFALALVYKQLGRYDLAQSRLNSVLQADPNFPGARAELDAVRRLAAATPSRQ
jgi:tetratricopeptide (TPR) repeat protein